MYGNKAWHKAPLWLIPATFLWAGLEILLDHFQVVSKLCERFPKKKNFIQCSARVLCYCTAHIVVASIIVIIEHFTGINLMDYGSG